jgi:hypothetical protein
MEDLSGDHDDKGDTNNDGEEEEEEGETTTGDQEADDGQDTTDPGATDDGATTTIERHSSVKDGTDVLDGVDGPDDKEEEDDDEKDDDASKEAMDDAVDEPEPQSVGRYGTRGGGANNGIDDHMTKGDDNTMTEKDDEDVEDDDITSNNNGDGQRDGNDDKYFVDGQEDNGLNYGHNGEQEDSSFLASKGTHYFEPNLPQMDHTYRLPLPNGDIDLELQSEGISPPMLMGLLSIIAIAICMFRKPRKFAKGKKANKISYQSYGSKREVPVY